MQFKFFAYRDWALSGIEKSNISGPVFTDPSAISWQDFNCEDSVFVFVGWSWRVPDDFVGSHMCVCYHPSDLPSYAGGSPIQNQIIDGVTFTYASIFRMTSTLDSGPVIAKVPISLKGTLSDVFSELSRSVVICLNIISIIDDWAVYDVIEPHLENNKIKNKSRRKPNMSEVTIADLERMNLQERHNFIRCQQAPYPGAKLCLTDGTFVTLSGVLDANFNVP